MDIREDVYETDDLVAQYCEFHYGQTYFAVPNFPARCAALCGEYTRERPRRKLVCIHQLSHGQLAITSCRTTGLNQIAIGFDPGHSGV